MRQRRNIEYPPNNISGRSEALVMESKSLGNRFSLEVLKEISRRWLGPRGPGIVETKIKELSYWSGPKTMGEFLTILDRVEKAAARHLGEGQATVMVSEMFHAVKR